MIGSLIYYGLFPLTHVFVRLSDFLWKRDPVIIHGKAVCDSRARSRRRLDEQQTVLLDEWCIAGIEGSETPTRVQKIEGLVESKSVLEINKVVVEQKCEMEEDKEKIPSQEERQRFRGMVTETGGVCALMSAVGFSCHSSSYQAAPSSTPAHADSDNQDLLKRSQASQDCTNGYKFFETTADGAEEREDDGLVTAENVDGTRGSEAQESLVYDLSALLTDSHTQSFTNHTWLQPAPTGWHFPVGIGLSDVVYHPLQFPGTSYYCGFQESANPEVFQSSMDTDLVMWRVWEELCKSSSSCMPPHAICVDPGSTFDFTVMSYNILAQDLLETNPEMYVHCSEAALAWDIRLQNILKELQTWEPDIICLQEVQENHFHEQLYPVLIEMGYDCVYKRRTGNKTDGCAVCYNTMRFTTLSVRLLEFQRHNPELLDRDNVGIVLLLQPTTEHDEGIRFQPVCVANTHLLFNPRRGDVKLAQLAIVLAEIDNMVRQCKVKGHECEVILCGDFNSLPKTPLYQLIVTGQLYYHGLPNWMVSGQEDLSYRTHHRRLYAPLWPNSLGINDNCRYYDSCDAPGKETGKLQYNHDFLQQLRYCPAACVRPPDLEHIPGVTDNTPTPEEPQPFPPRRFRNTISHGLNLSSVYGPKISGTEHCAVTTLHSHAAAMVDYIFYSTRRGHRGCDDKVKGLKLLGRLALLSEADLWALNGLPNEVFPSDHISLLAKFQLC